MKTTLDFKILFILTTLLIWTLFLVLFANQATAQDAPMPTELPEDMWGWVAFASFFGMKLLTKYVPSTIQGMPIYNIFMKILNMLVMNTGKARNADDLPLAIANKPPAPLTAEEQAAINAHEVGMIP